MARGVLAILAPLWALAAIGLTVGSPLPQQASAIDPVRLLLVVPLLLFWPGYVLTGLGGSRHDALARAVLSVGVSFALFVPVGLLLNGLGQMDPVGWVRAFSSVVLVGWCAGLLVGQPEPGIKLRVTPRGVAAFAGFAGAAILAVVSVQNARVGVDAHREFRFTAFWMVPSTETNRSLVTVGLRNEEAVEGSYEIDLLVDGALTGRLPAVAVPVGETRTFQMALPHPSQQGARVEAWLYRNGNRSIVYRKVWVEVSAVRSDSVGEG